MADKTLLNSAINPTPCDLDHTEFQPDDKEWQCPKCGETELFWIEESADPSGQCPLIHVEDTIICQGCGLFGTGKQITEMMAKKSTRPPHIPCPTCHGPRTIDPDQDPLQIFLKAIEDEPELPGDMPLEMQQRLMKAIADRDLDLIAETMRVAVRLTKAGIAGRVQERLKV